MKLRPLMFAAMTLFVSVTTSVQLAGQEHNQRPPNYVVADLGTLGGTFGEAKAVNNEGSVAGDATLLGDTVKHAFLWRKGRMKDLETLGGPNSIASSLNERDEVVGASDTLTADPLGEDPCGFGTYLVCLPFIWQHGSMTPLPTLGGNNGQALTVNSRGLVAGLAENDTWDASCESLQFKPVLWDKGEIHELPTVDGDPVGRVNAINDNGHATGLTFDCAIGFTHGVLWRDGRTIDLGNPEGFELAPVAINNRDQVVGLAESLDGTAVAFLLENGVLTNLGILAGDVFSFAFGINNKGQIVGYSCDQDFDCRAFLWQDGTMTDLNTLVRNPNAPFLEIGNSINSRGQIAGMTSEPVTNLPAAFLATPSHGEGIGEIASPAVTQRTNPRPRVVLPDDIRRILRQRMGFRFAIPALGAPRN